MSYPTPWAICKDGIEASNGMLVCGPECMERIVTAVNAYEDLIAEVRRLQHENAELHKLTTGGPFVPLHQYEELQKLRAEGWERLQAEDWEWFDAEVQRTAGGGDRATLGLGLAGEAGEVCDLLKKELAHRRKVNSYTEELGDVLWYVSALAFACGTSLREVAKANVDKLRKRYPNGYSHEASAKRADKP